MQEKQIVKIKDNKNFKKHIKGGSKGSSSPLLFSTSLPFSPLLQPNTEPAKQIDTWLAFWGVVYFILQLIFYIFTVDSSRKLISRQQQNYLLRKVMKNPWRILFQNLTVTSWSMLSSSHIRSAHMRYAKFCGS